jgi:hypothetical protein
VVWLHTQLLSSYFHLNVLLLPEVLLTICGALRETRTVLK